MVESLTAEYLPGDVVYYAWNMEVGDSRGTVTDVTLDQVLDCHALRAPDRTASKVCIKGDIESLSNHHVPIIPVCTSVQSH